MNLESRKNKKESLHIQVAGICNDIQISRHGDETHVIVCDINTYMSNKGMKTEQVGDKKVLHVMQLNRYVNVAGRKLGNELYQWIGGQIQSSDITSRMWRIK